MPKKREGSVLADGPAYYELAFDGEQTVTLTIKCASHYDAILVVDKMAADFKRGCLSMSILTKKET